MTLISMCAILLCGLVIEDENETPFLQLTHQIKANDGHLQWVEFSPNGKWVAVCGDHFVQAFDLHSGKLIRKFEGNKKDIIRFDFSPNGKWVASAGADSTIHVWDAKTGNVVRVLRDHTDKLIGVNFSPDSRYLVSTGRQPNDGTIKIWDCQTWSLCDTAKCPRNTNAMFAAISPDNKTVVASGYRGTIRVFDFDGKALKLRYTKKHDGGEMVPHAAFSADGQFFITSGWDKTLRKWHAKTGQTVWSVKAPPYARCFETARFSADGKTVFCVTRDETIQARNAKTGELENTFRWHDEIRGMAVSHDTRFLATAGHAGKIKVWKILE